MATKNIDIAHDIRDIWRDFIEGFSLDDQDEAEELVGRTEYYIKSLLREVELEARKDEFNFITDNFIHLFSGHSKEHKELLSHFKELDNLLGSK